MFLDNIAKLIDFGSAKKIEGSFTRNAAKTYIGTEMYMSPQLLQGKFVSDFFEKLCLKKFAK